MEKITVGVLTVSDRCANNEAVDTSGPNLVELIKNGILKNSDVVETCLLPDDEIQIENKLKEWCDLKNIQVILTTGGTGIAKRDVTPEVTSSLIDKEIPGIPNLMFKHSSEITPLAALSRSVCGVRKSSLIINLPGSKKASEECLRFIASVIPHAVDLIRGDKKNVGETHLALQNKKSKVISGKIVERPRHSAYVCLKVCEAQKIIMEKIYLLKKEKVIHAYDALGFVLAQEIVAVDDLPPFDSSLKDGYAVQSSDMNSEKKVVGYSCAGNLSNFDVFVSPGCCIRINTGAAIPKGANAVVQVEDTSIISCTDDKTEETKIHFSKLPVEGQDIRFKGSDFKKGEVLLEKGTYIGPSVLGLLAAAGVTDIKVFAKPVIGIFSTGDELVNPGVELLLGQIRDSNRVTLINILKQENFPALDLGIVNDNPDALFNSLEKGFRVADIIVTSGSMSMGDKDYLKEVLIKDFEAEICFGRVFMKPGKPTAFAILTFEGKPKFWFGLPGNPASAAVTAQLFLIPALKKISGYEKPFLSSFEAELKNDIQLEDRPHYQRAIFSFDNKKKCFVVETTGNQSSSRIASCAKANCLLEIPEKKSDSNALDTTSDIGVPDSFQLENSNSKDIICKGELIKALLLDKNYF